MPLPHQGQSSEDAPPSWLSPLNQLARPPWLRNDSLSDDRWIVETDDPRGRRDTRQPINFRVPIAPGPVYLTDPEHSHDLLTTKLYLYESISGDQPWLSSAVTMLLAANNLITFIRWRIAQQIPDMASLNRDWYNQFVDILRVEGPGGLANANKRISIYVEELRAGTRSIPLVGHGSKRLVSLDAVAQQLGFAQATSFPAGYLDPIVAYVADHHPSLIGPLVSPRRVNKDSGARSKNQLGALLRPWDLLWQLRHKLEHDPIGYRAHDAIFTLHSQALALQRTPHRPVPLAPEYQTCYLINASLSYLDIADKLLFIHVSLQRIYAQSDGRERRNRIKELVRKTKLKDTIKRCGVGNATQVGETYIRGKGNRRSPDTVVLYNLLYDFLPAACLIVIAAFTARRTGELESLQHGCVFGDTKGRRYMSCWIEKSLRAIDNVPIPLSVEKAISVLEELSATRRVATGEPWITLFRGPSVGPDAVGKCFGSRVRRFIDFADVPALANGTRWRFELRQFRTFFATVYYHRFHYPSLTALSDFLKHYNPDTTKSYITASVQGSYLHLSEERNRKQKQLEVRTMVEQARARLRDFEEGRISFITTLAKDALAGDGQISGAAGEAWRRELEQLTSLAERNLILTTDKSDNSWDVQLRSWAKSKVLEPHPQNHSYCTCDGSIGSVNIAGCVVEAKKHGSSGEDGARGRDLAFASDLTCSVCPHNLQTSATERYWRQKEAEAARAAAMCLTPRQRAAAVKQLASCREHIRRCFKKMNG
jgi:hypothetical protein